VRGLIAKLEIFRSSRPHYYARRGHSAACRSFGHDHIADHDRARQENVGCRPRSASTAKANSDASLLSLRFALVVGAPGVALLCVPGELASFKSWNFRARALTRITVVTLPPLMGVLAWNLMRRINSRFDEWVGRPLRLSPIVAEVRLPSERLENANPAHTPACL
jgi:hypothetical protein